LTEADCQFKLHLRELTTGKILHEFKLSETTWVKEGRDLVVAHLEDEEEFLHIWQSKTASLVEPIDLEDYNTNTVQPVVAVGHDFAQEDGENDYFVPTRFDVL